MKQAKQDQCKVKEKHMLHTEIKKDTTKILTI